MGIIDSYSGPAKIVQANGIEVDVTCSYDVIQENLRPMRGGPSIPGMTSWTGVYTSPDAWSTDPDRVLDLNTHDECELIREDGLRGKIRLKGDGRFQGTGPHPSAS